MSKTPIINIDINDEKFRRFMEGWDEYLAGLKKQPEAWQAMNKRIGEFQKLQMAAGVSAERALDAAVKMDAALKKTGHAQNANASAASRGAKAFRSMAHDTVKIGKGVLSITKHLLKWGSIIGGIGLGVGAFGIDRLANSAFNQQRGARGMNVSIGQAASMRVNMGRYFSPDSALSAVANAQQNYGQWSNFAALGLNPAEVAQRGTFGATLEVAQAARQAWMKYHNAAMPQIQAAERLGFSVSDLRRMAASKNFGAAVSRTRQDVGTLGMPAKIASEWSRLSIQLSRAGQRIENTVIKGLAPLAPDLTKLSHAIANAIGAFLHTPELKSAIKHLSGWIGDAGKDFDHFAKYLGSKQFQQDAKTFGQAIGQLAQETVTALRYLGLIKSPGPTFEQLKHAATKQTHPTMFGNAMIRADIASRRANGEYIPTHIHALNQRYAKKYGVPLGILDRLSMDESGYGRHLISKAGAVGVDQLMPATASALGVSDRTNVKQNIRGGARYLSILYGHYHSWRKAVAAYHDGPGNVDKDIAQYGKDWFAHTTKAAQQEVANVVGSNSAKTADAIAKLLKVAQRRQAQSNKYVTVTNATPAQIAVSANAVTP